ncbi:MULTISPECIES: electron transport complex subunit RsxE [Mogibacterium]|uniref:Ion-translocating oxidoreductase complex subunit E n=2 Tax=Mogibacterium timidum TaxID=35519 RepID=X8J8R7_9FIRM|nr:MULTISPECIES: electron transport complex subunit E [Mogibacterium]EJU21947.1 electron transport complex, RnfABCDGE type, E subunit [Mogibacterium sp. CM50]EUC60034.1 electron transport complex, RnfABCDGE type, E subunit [Mogibacterium timidum ATCC 33093]NWO22818.1 electron transport complex subunit E [Mogibacterium timidum]
MSKKSKLSIITNGIIKENPVLVLLIGTCPTLATSSSASNGLGMGLSTTAVLIAANIVISLLRKVIPDKVRIPCYIVVIAGFVTVVQFLLEAYVPALYKSLGLFIPLIVVNCIILGRAEAFANKNTVVDSALDGIGMGLGFTLTLTVMGTIRELLGAGTWFGMTVFGSWFTPIGFFNLAPGGFFVFGLLIAVLNVITKGKALKKKTFSCGTCPMYNSCNLAEAKEIAAEEKGAEA